MQMNVTSTTKKIRVERDSKSKAFRVTHYPKQENRSDQSKKTEVIENGNEIENKSHTWQCSQMKTSHLIRGRPLTINLHGRSHFT